ncbi:MAG: hypothetical protein ACI9EW_000499 [Cellvibrionaceae bacterium]|jgi:hypothetical protein
MEKRTTTSESGHVEILGAALLAAVCAIILVIGANNGSGIVVWIGGIGLAAGIMGQFWFTHEAIKELHARIDEVEKK